MKMKSILFLSTLSLFASATLATVVDPKTTAGTGKLQGTDANDILYLNTPTASTPQSLYPNRFEGINATVKAIKANEGQDQGILFVLNPGAGTTIDINTASDTAVDVDALILPNNELQITCTDLNFKNSATGSNAWGVVNVKRINLATGAIGDVVQKQLMNFQTGNFKVSAIDTYLGSHYSTSVNVASFSTYNISKDANVVHSGNINVLKAGILNIDGQFKTIKPTEETTNITFGNKSEASVVGTTGKFTSGTGTAFTINDQATLTNKGEMIVESESKAIYNSGSTYNIDGVTTYNLGALVYHKSGSTTNITGTLNSYVLVGSASDGFLAHATINIGSATNKVGELNFAQTSASGKRITVASNINNYGSIVMSNDDAIQFTGNVVNNGTMNIKGGVYVKNGHLTLGEDATTIFTSYLNLQTRLALVDNNATITLKSGIVDEKGRVANIATVGNANANLYMNIYADVKFGFLNQGTNDAVLNINLYEDGILRLMDGDALRSIHADINIFNFDENRVYVGTSSTAEELQFIKLYAGEGKDTFLGTALVNNNGWLTLVAVPEPAEWAMIFGGIALALAIYRRRK
jgi:hypothetical protein